MIINLKIVRVNSDYCDYLRKFDNKVAYNKNEKELRPFFDSENYRTVTKNLGSFETSEVFCF